MGKRKIEIEKIDDKQKKYQTFSKRRMGIFHKASELAKLCNVQTAVIVFSPAGKPFVSVSNASSVDVVLQRYLKHTSGSGDDSSMDAVGVTCEVEEAETVKEDGDFWGDFWGESTVDPDKSCSREELLSVKNRLELLRVDVGRQLSSSSRPRFSKLYFAILFIPPLTSKILHNVPKSKGLIFTRSGC